MILHAIDLPFPIQMSSRIPPLLEPYLGLPEEASLIVLTSVLGASTNWLVLRYLYSFLSRGRQQQEGGSDEGSQGHDTGLVLVSFLRDGAFWHDGAGRLVSLHRCFFCCRFGLVSASQKIEQDTCFLKE